MTDLQVDSDSLMKIVIDSATPLNAQLSAKYKRSFAYPSMKDRAPVVITRVIDYLSRDKNLIVEKYGPDVKEEIKAAIGELSQLKNHLQTSKPFELFTSEDADTPFWNEHLDTRLEHREMNNYYESDWLFAECYMYRRIREIFATKRLMNSVDPFSHQKTKLLRDGLLEIEPLFCRLHNEQIMNKTIPLPLVRLREELSHLLKWSLWANRMDLSFKSGGGLATNFAQSLESWNPNIIVDDSATICSLFTDPDNSDKTVDIVMDNGGLEMLSDLTLADYLVARCGVKKINFHVKPIPWYVSDVISRDFTQGVESVACSKEPYFKDIGQRWKKYLASEKWTVSSDLYWCLGLPYQYMEDTDPCLYDRLSDSSLIIFKGDLNYRKLVRDINWEPTTPFHKALDPFKPAPILAIRTLKADTVCGLTKGQAEHLSADNKEWWICGEYGLIQCDYSN